MTFAGRYSWFSLSVFAVCVVGLTGYEGSACPPPPAWYQGCGGWQDVPCSYYESYQDSPPGGAYLQYTIHSISGGGLKPMADFLFDVSFRPGPSLGNGFTFGERVAAAVRYSVCAAAHSPPPGISVVPVLISTKAWGGIWGAGSGWVGVWGPGASGWAGIGYYDFGPPYSFVVWGTNPVEVPVGGSIEIELAVTAALTQDANDPFGTGHSILYGVIDPDVEIDPDWEFKDYFTLEFSENLIPHGDLERDGDLDLYDVAAFMNCFSGTETQTLPECAAADFDGDGTVGLDHFAELARTLSGPISLPRSPKRLSRRGTEGGPRQVSG